MRINLALILSIIVAVGLVAIVFTAFQISSERQKLNTELADKTMHVSEDFYRSHLKGLEQGDSIEWRKINPSILSQYSFIAIDIYYNADSVLPINDSAETLFQHSSDNIARALSADSSAGNMIRVNGKKTYEYIKVIHRTNLPSIAAVFYSDASYIKNLLNGIWLRNFVRWFTQALVISLVTLMIIRWGILSPLNRIVEWVKAARFGNIEQIKRKPPVNFLAPLYKEISGIAQAMQEARAIAQEEARLRTTAEAVWTPERLNEEMKQILQNKMMVVVSNREPYMHVRAGREINVLVPASGMVTAMEPILKACGGLWIASGSGDADRETVDESDKVQVPPYENKYTLRRVWLTKEQEDHYYYGFSNEGLWPLCHIAHTRPVFRKEDWEFYQQVNAIYAKTVVEEIKNQEDPFILVQDYHFALLPKLIKDQRPDAKVAIFWHIPWPNPESFGICPWQKELLSGMLGADLIGFHTQYHCNNFLETVNNTLESRVIWENFSVKIGNQFTLVKPFPISIAFTLKDYDNSDGARLEPSELLKHYGLQAQYIYLHIIYMNISLYI